MTDAEIITKCWDRDEQAIEGMMDSYSGYCTAVASRILAQREDVEECVSDTWLGAWNAMPPQKPSCLRVFLGKITRNLSIDRFRRAHAEKRGGGEVCAALEELEECVSGGRSPEDQVFQLALAEEVGRFLRGLPRRECSVFLRRYFYLESVNDIALRYQMSPNHVYVLLHRSREKLRKMLEQEGFQ